jgi:hypothetical protein
VANFSPLLENHVTSVTLDLEAAQPCINLQTVGASRRTA